jgi:hypothetical protein
MKKLDLFPILDQQEKRLDQVQSLTNLLLHAVGSPEYKQNDLCGIVSLLNDVLKETQHNHKNIAEGVISLFVVNANG